MPNEFRRNRLPSQDGMLPKRSSTPIVHVPVVTQPRWHDQQNSTSKQVRAQRAAATECGCQQQNGLQARSAPFALQDLIAIVDIQMVAIDVCRPFQRQKSVFKFGVQIDVEMHFIRSRHVHRQQWGVLVLAKWSVKTHPPMFVCAMPSCCITGNSG